MIAAIYESAPACVKMELEAVATRIDDVMIDGDNCDVLVFRDSSTYVMNLVIGVGYSVPDFASLPA